MKSERVTQAWEFYRDNCPGFKEPMRKEFRKLDGYVSSIEAENTKLRELVRKYGEYTDQDRCEGCACKSRCSDGDVDECWQLTEIRELTRKLEVGVDE